ncbi:MAG: MBL fold metallo-hydrolase, partial [Saprospiraceae bacterium]|nr:MBL fold metallo-hydrolase [Saprospiraceae bacterium]
EYENRRRAKKKKGKRKKGLVKPLYTSQDIPPVMELFETIGYQKWLHITDGVRAQFRDAGHILGSGSVTLEIIEGDKKTMFGFTGDVGRPNRPILRDPKAMPEVDYLICESTYGNRDHIEKPAEEERFLNIINQTCVEQSGKLIIPAFSVGRTQEIVYMLDRLENEGRLPHIPVFVDSPLAVNATTVFGSHPECYDNDLHEYMLIDDNPFGFTNLTYVRNVDVSKSLNTFTEPCIIISSAGMMNAGRIRHHLFNNIDNPQNTLLIVGYCAPHTTGGILRKGTEAIKLFGEWKMVKAKIEIMDSFSAHADRHELIEYLDNQKGKVKTIFLVHGEFEAQQDFKMLLDKNGFENVAIPDLGQTVELE